jgi:FkbM family methyltransferase
MIESKWLTGRVGSESCMQQIIWYIGKLLENRLTRPIKRSIVRSIAAKTGPRSLLNHYYGLLSDEAKSRFHARYSKIFREEGVLLASGEWVIHFINRKIRLPLRPSWSWLDWDGAVSVIGHDIEVKQTYAALIRSDQRPALFLDVGANYGTHSILFLSAGIPVIAFEPNPTCLSYFQVVCELNGLAGRWEQVAIGNDGGQIELVYPEKETWLGSVSSDNALALRKSTFVRTTQVPLKKLDDYCREIPRDNVVVKIDVEGYEREVIQGASQLLLYCKPKLIFESNDAKLRGDLFRLLAEYGYSVHQLPWQPSGGSRVLEIDEFLTNTMTNFMAVARSS